MFKNYALVSGPAFSISYGLGGIFMGQLVDKYPRKYILALICLGWSVSSIVSGATNSFFVLCAMRFLCGVFVSATEPCAYSLLGDYFPKRLRTTANSLMNTSTYLGSGFASLSVMAVAAFGWRAAYYIMGGSGVVLSALAFIAVKEPERGYQARLAYQENKEQERL